ncbi:MAG: response regulator [Prevotellaceae bacterium]|jgi:DNA-binding response OmpR family regulator|nr:response regulator [Prevotellaceae bacterium]
MTVRLHHHQHSFSIRFTAIDFANTHNRRFTWMLDGIDRDFNVPAYETTANYTNMQPGDYTFRLRYIDTNNAILDERTLLITVQPPFWHTVWARMLEVLLVMAIATGIYFTAKRRIHKKQVQERIDFFLRMAHDIRNPLTLIKAPLYELKQMPETTQHGEYLFDTIARNLDKLTGVFNRLLDYKRELDEVRDTDHQPIETIEATEPTAAIESETDGANYTALMVESNEELCNFLTLALKANIKMAVSRNPDEAWLEIQTLHPDVIITDLFMPALSGVGLLEKIKNTFETSHIPVIMLSAATDRQLKLRTISSGADAYIEKPFEVAELKIRIENILNNRRLLRRKFIGTNIHEIDTENTLDAQFIRQATEIVAQNLTNRRFSVSDFSQAMGISRSLLYNKFNTLTGHTPKDYIKLMRMKKAIALFRENRYTINEVSYMVGFEEAPYFSTCFRKIYGKTPTKFIEDELTGN